VDDLKILLSEGYFYEGRNIVVNLQAIVADAPARAFIKSVKCHGGYFACEKCTVQGVYYEKRVVYLTDSTEVCRTDSSFRNQIDDQHHLGESPFLPLPLDLIKVFPYEYMHLICIGVTKKLIFLWLKGKVSKFRTPSRDTNTISDRLHQIYSFVPKEFNRKPRPINEFNRWKASELRQFLLYSGPVALKGVLSESYYNHFMSLHLSCRILASETFAHSQNRYASSLLQYFVTNFAILYGKKFVSYNVHGLLHISDDVLHLGRLDNFSAFRFENHLGRLKRMVKNKNNPLTQVCYRLIERQSLNFQPIPKQGDKVELSSPHWSGPLIDGSCNPQFKVAHFKKFQLGCDERDGTVLLKW